MTSAFHPSRLIGFDGPGLQILSREKLPYGITPVPKLLGAWKFVYPGDHSKDGHSAVPRFRTIVCSAFPASLYLCLWSIWHQQRTCCQAEMFWMLV